MALLLRSGALFAFGFEPISRDFEPSGPESVQTFRLENEGDKNIAIRLRILTRDMDEYGKETYGPADGKFLVYPSQVVLKPKAVQSVKVQWKGEAEPEREACFRILAEQVPVNFADDTASGSRIQILFRYLGAIYVLPKGAEPDIVLESNRPATGPSGEKGLELVFLNKGRAHAILGNLSVILSAGNPSEAVTLTVPDRMLKGITGENVLPEKRRRFFLAVPEPFSHDDTRVSFRFDPIR